MKTIIINYKDFVESMNDNKRVEKVLTALQTAKVEEQNPNMIIVNYSDEGYALFNVIKIENEMRYVQSNGTAA